MRNSRVLTGSIRDFFETPSPMRECIADHVRNNLKNGTKSVALCFRGNAATLYYHCHQLLRIRSSREGIIGEFDFRHARFSQNYRQICKRLNGLHVDTSSFSEGSKPPKNFIRFSLKTCDAAEFHEILEIYRGLIDDFFDPQKTEYAFGAPTFKHEKSLYLEKDRQQQLWARYFLDDALMYYDLEYSERFAAKCGVHGRFDLLGLRRESDGYTLLLTELKSSPQALGGKSGVMCHERDYLGYLDSPLLAARKAEACDTVRLLYHIFGKPYPASLSPEKIDNAKIKFVFSDKVVGAGKDYCPSDGRIEKVYLENGTELSY